jgi:hypothetical protein
MSQTHPSKLLITPHGDRVLIDDDIVPFITALWDMGLITWNSCQDNFGYVWVEFDPPHAVTFLSCVARNTKDENLRYRALGPYDVSPSRKEDLAGYHAPSDSWLIAANTHYDWEHDPSPIELTISIRFPRKHLPLVMEALPRVETEHHRQTPF